MATDELLELARTASALARKKGAQEVAATASRARDVDVEWRDGKLEKLSEATTRSLGLALYVDGRYAVMSTSDLRSAAVEAFVGEAVAMTRALAPDPFRSLPDPSLYPGAKGPDLELEDGRHEAVTAHQRREAAAALEAAARAVKGSGAILSVSTSVGDRLAESARVHSNGFEGQRRETIFGVSANVSVKDADGRRPEDGFGATARFQATLPTLEAVGRQASERTLARLGSQKMPSAQATMVLENRAGANLVSRLLGPLAASALQQKRSFLEGKVGQVVASPLLDLTDDPLVPRGLASRHFDGEGLASRQLKLFEKGALRSYLVDTYYGKKLKLPPTTGSLSNLSWTLGKAGLPELLAQVKEGVYVTGFLGGNSNATTGDFSLGVRGFRIRNGALAEPVSEMNVADNHLALWKKLAAVGNDPYPWSSFRTPTLVFEGVTFAGV